VNLRDKLKRYEKNNKSSPSIKKDRGYLNKKLFPNTIIKNEQGKYLKTQKIYPKDYQHGLYEMNKFFEDFNNYSLKQITNTDTQIKKEGIKDNILFIDTETTGLMGGTGTVAFLIGVGYFKDNEFFIEQYLMRDYDEEKAMLNDIKKLLLSFDIIVSFNGKSFDLPLIQTRIILNRLKMPDFNLHVDLLHSARRIWSFLDSCSLKSLEDNVLNFKRIDDIEGYLIPSIFFRFIEFKDLKLLKPVLEHNSYDILSLVTLFTHLKEIHLGKHKKLNSHEFFHMGRIKEKQKEFENSINYLKKAVETAQENDIKYRAYKKLSWQYKRINQYEKAVEIWQKMIKERGAVIFPYIEMAKYLEHKQKDYKKALYYTKEAEKLLDKNKMNTKNHKCNVEKIEHRRSRLLKRLERS